MTDSHTNPTKPVDLDALAELERAATPGPWYWTVNWHSLDAPGGNRIIWPANSVFDSETARESLGSCGHNCEVSAPHNAAFIAALRNAAPALIAELRAMREALRAIAHGRNELGIVLEPSETMRIAREALEAEANAPAPDDDKIVEAMRDVDIRQVMPMYGEVPFAFLVKAVGEATGVPWVPDDGFVGHQIVPTMNFNSLNRIVSAALAVARQHLTRPTAMWSEAEVRAEIERLSSEEVRSYNYNANNRNEAMLSNEAHLDALRWVLNEQETGR